jgi:aminoglycoside phosphotransferase (APT) family kinase protein
MLGAFFGGPYLDWWLSYSENPGFMMPYYNHWLVKKSAARAFSRGVIKLDRLQPSMVEYEVLQTPIGPEDTVQVHGSYALLGDHSRAGTPKVDPRFMGTHARLSRSVQLLELSDKLSPRSDSETKQRSATVTPKLLPWVSRLTQPLFSSLLAAWLLIPAPVRMLAYRALRQSAQRFIEPDCDTVQRLPFGLYLKCARDLDSLRNEVNALRMVRQYTSVPVPKPLDFVTAPTPTQDGPAEGEGYLLMSRIPGVPLSRCHEVLSDKDAAHIEAQMQDHITQLRAIPQPTGTSYAIYDTLGGSCRDPRLRDGEPVGPFADEAEFNQLLREPDDPARSGHRIFFTHADLNPRNIIVDRTARRDGSLGWQVAGIVDWEMAGYYPEYWEYTKALYERFRWPRRYQNMMHRVFRLLGDYSKEFDVELRSWEAGM